MTLHEHARTIWINLPHTGCTGSSFDQLPIGGKLPFYRDAYAELWDREGKLQDQLNEAERKLTYFETENLRLREQLVDTPIRPPTPDLDQIKRERAGARVALCYIRAALGLSAEDPLDPSAIAERAVRVINEHREKRTEAICPLCRGDGRRFYDATIGTTRFCPNCGGKGDEPQPEPQPEPAKCTACGGTGDTYYGHPMVCRECENRKQPPPEPLKKAVYEWRNNELLRNGEIVGNIRLLQHIPFMIGWKVLSAEIWFPVTGQAATFPLAKAAVEAVVRAHYGDTL